MIEEENLLFIISQPRSGSSLLQQLLTNTKEIASVPEPWLMLPLVSVFKPVKTNLGYNPNYAQINFENYLRRYTNGDELLRTKIRNLALDLYRLNYLNPNQKYFLDKTPRYYHIIDELFALFPRAKFIFLTRNPLAVFSSIMEMYGIKVFSQPDRYADIFVAPRTIAKAISVKNTSSYFMKYEDLISDPVQVLEGIRSFLDLSQQIDFRYKVDEMFLKSQAIDPKSVSKHTSPVEQYLDSWKQTINDSQRKRMAIEYINMLEDDCVAALGYDKNEILTRLNQHIVKRNFVTIPLSLLINKRTGMAKSLYRSMYFKVFDQVKLQTK